jgi:DNA-binding response OmpR family regulator
MSSGRKVKFLLVDYHVEIRKEETFFLNEAGYKDIHQARYGAEAWSIVRSLGADFVISALTLPDMSGLALLNIIRTEPTKVDTPFILIVDEITKGKVLEAGEAGVSDIITLPLKKESFLSKIEKIFRKEENAEDTEFKVLYNQGMELMSQGNLEGALKTFESTLVIHESAELFEEALTAFQRATSINASHATSYHRMGEIYQKLGQLDKAEENFGKAAEIYLDKYMDKDAEKVLMEAVKLNPKTVNIFNTLGILYRRRENYQEAIRAYRRAQKINPDDENILYNLGRLYLSIGNTKECIKNLDLALNLNPDFTEAKKLLSHVLDTKSE